MQVWRMAYKYISVMALIVAADSDGNAVLRVAWMQVSRMAFL